MVGSIFQLEILIQVSTLLLIPTLILYYRYRAKKWFLAMVVALVLFYVRDLLMLGGLGNYLGWIMLVFAIAVIILYIFSLTSFRRSKIMFVELLSLIIMYG